MIRNDELDLGEVILYADTIKGYNDNQIPHYTGRVTCRKSCNHDILWTKFCQIKDNYQIKNNKEMAVQDAINLMHRLGETAKQDYLKGLKK